MIEITLYQNRRLYGENRYLTFEDVQAYVKQGEHVKVLRKGTKEDVTRHVLFQILTRYNQSLTELQLHQLVRNGG